MENKNASEFDWGIYFKEGEESLKKLLEEDAEMWATFTNSTKRYMLISKILISEKDINKPCGTVTDYLDYRISSDNLESLRSLWKTEFIQQSVRLLGDSALNAYFCPTI